MYGIIIIIIIMIMTSQGNWEWDIEKVCYKPLKNDDNEYSFFQSHPCKSFIYISDDLLSFNSSPCSSYEWFS